MSDENNEHRENRENLENLNNRENPENRNPTTEKPAHAMIDDSDADDHEQTENETADQGAEPESPDESGPHIDGDLRRKLNYAMLFGLGLLAMIAVIQFYLNMSSVINQWVTHEFRSLFQALFNLVVLLVVGAAISRQVKRLAN